MATLIFPEHPSPVADAEALRKACQGWGTDEKTIISILGRRNAIQRKLIRQAYGDMYQEDLIKRLESELSGDFEVLWSFIVCFSYPTHDFNAFRKLCTGGHYLEERDAILLNVAIKQVPLLDYCVIVESSCIRSHEELLAIKCAYQICYKHSVEEGLAQHTTGDIRELLFGLVSLYRYKGDAINVRLASSEAKILHCVMSEKAIFHEETIRIITTRSKAQVLATLNHFKDDYGTSITKHLRDGSSLEYLSALRAAIRCICNHHKYYEKVVRRALNKPGTDEDFLTRVIITSAEKDLKDIKELFQKRNSMSLEHAVAKDTSGDYKAFLLTLLGKEINLVQEFLAGHK